MINEYVDPAPSLADGHTVQPRVILQPIAAPSILGL
jgi:hypothetical protein